MLEIVKKDWRKVTILSVVILALIIAVYSIGCCAFRNLEEIPITSEGGWGASDR